MSVKSISLRIVYVLIVRVASIAQQTARVVLHARNANGSTIRQFAIKQTIHFWPPLVMRTDRYAPVVAVEINGVKCRALLDTGAGSSYASSALIN